ncbi:Flp pilus assembly protein CpaB [Alcaligenaceae bacterium C4P045]|nr:Flp pilus assembly protein CpaB [Alcaligenaceae bacterium C4P045]
MGRLTKFLALGLLVLAVVLGIVAYQLAVAPAPVIVSPAEPVAPVVRRDAAPTFGVLVAAKALPAGALIATDALEVVQWPVSPAHGFVSADGVVGKRLRRDVAQGEPITAGALAIGLATYLEPGQRAVSIPVDDVIGASHRVVPGDYVDLFFMLDKGQEIQGAQTRLLQSKVRVLAYGDASVDGPLTTDGAAAASGQTQGARTAMLAVPIEQVNELLLALKQGRLQMALRNPNDELTADRTLFAERRPVLAPRKDLSAADKARVETPANAAYAGDSLMQLQALAVTQPASVAAAAPAPGVTRTSNTPARGRTIQIIRGSASETVAY